MNKSERARLWPVDGGPAFPIPHESEVPPSSGMSLRDWFAGQAMNAVCVGLGADLGDDRRQLLAFISYACADAMLAERMEKPR